jgi:hypothetical protein
MAAASSTIPIPCSETARSNIVCGLIDPNTMRGRGGGDGSRGAELSKIAARYSSSSSSSAVVASCGFASAEASGADRGASNAARSG